MNGVAPTGLDAFFEVHIEFPVEHSADLQIVLQWISGAWVKRIAHLSLDISSNIFVGRHDIGDIIRRRVDLASIREDALFRRQKDSK